VRYTVAPRSLVTRDVACPPKRSEGGRHGALLLVMLPDRRNGGHGALFANEHVMYSPNEEQRYTRFFVLSMELRNQ
jgi:hypothetical protein